MDFAIFGDPNKFFEAVSARLNKLPQEKLILELFRFVAIGGLGFVCYEPFVRLVREWYLKNNKEKLIKLANAISAHYSYRELKKRATDLKYWSLYLGVNKEKERIVKKEKLKDLHFVTSEACRRVARRHNMNSESLRTRYYEKFKIAKDLGLSDNDIRNLLVAHYYIIPFLYLKKGKLI